MPRIISWNGRGTTLLTAAQRLQVETVANSARRDQTISVADPSPVTAVALEGTLVTINNETVGTMTGSPPGPAGNGR